MTTNSIYQSEVPATMPPGLEVETEDINGAKRQVVKVADSELPRGAATEEGLNAIVTAVTNTAGDSNDLISAGVSLKDYHNTNHFAEIDHFNTLRTANLMRLVGVKFIGNTKDANFWSESVENNGSVVQTAGTLVLKTNITANGGATYYTNRVARFVPMTTNIFRAVLKLGDTGIENNIRRWGMFDANNGAFFELNGTTLNVVTRASTTDTPIEKSLWNKYTLFDLDANYHAYEVHASYDSFSFYIDDILMHEINVAGLADLPSHALDLPVSLSNKNSNGSVSSVDLTVALATIVRVGELRTNPTYKSISSAGTNVLKYSSGLMHGITINTPGGASDTVILYDNISASGNVIASISIGKTTQPTTLTYNSGIPFNVGLTIVTNGTTNLTVVYE